MRRLERIKVGDEVKFTEDYLDFWLNEAYGLCSLNGIIKNEEEADDFMARKMLGLGYPYKAVVVQKLSPGVATDPASGEALSGYQVKVILKHGLQFKTAISIDNVSLYARRKDEQHV